MPPERFDASIRWSHADELESLCNRISESAKYVVTAADALLLGNLAGALNYARASVKQPPSVILPVPPPGDSPQPFTFQPGTLYFFQLLRDGRPGMSVSSGNIPCFGGVGDVPGEVTQWAMGATPPMHGKEGQYFTMQIESDQPQSGRYSME